MIWICEDVLKEPDAYRSAALRGEFRTFHFEKCSFHGIQPCPRRNHMEAFIASRYPSITPTLSFFRRSPQGQKEPHFIHSDVDMGDYSAVLYLNPSPPKGDGTDFWANRFNQVSSDVPHEFSKEGEKPGAWRRYFHVAAKFNRMVLFQSNRFHSRSIFDNWGDENEARLTQVTFFDGRL